MTPETVAELLGSWSSATPAELERARMIATAAVEKWGDEDEHAFARLRSGGIWNDHAAVQAALVALRAPRIDVAEEPLPDFAADEWNVPALRNELHHLNVAIADDHRVRQRITNMRVRDAWDRVHGGARVRREALITAITDELRRRGCRA